MSNFEDKVIVITGGTSGIGLASARALAAAGAHVYVSGRRHDAGQAAVREAGEGVRFIAADVTREAEVDALFERVVADRGRIDAVIASHGTLGRPGPVVEQSRADLQEVIDVNLVGTFLVARAAVRSMRAGGSLVLVASTAGNGVNFPGVSAYAATKAAVVAFAKSLALEVGGAGIRVNVLVPGGVDTPMFRSTMGATPESAAHIASLHVFERVARPEELATAAAFLAGDDSSFMTGSTMFVDGGMTTK